MFKSQIILTVFLFFSSFVFGQNIAPVVEWQRCFGSNDSEQAVSAITTSDGGFIFLGKYE